MWCGDEVSVQKYVVVMICNIFVNDSINKVASTGSALLKVSR